MRDSEEFWENNDNDNDNKCFQQQVLFIHDGYVNNQSNKPKTRRRRWTQKDMTNAFNAVKCTGMSLRGAASHYNVPESTLRDRVHGRVSLDCSRPGPPTFFTYEEEKKMVDHILFMSKIGYPYTRNQVVELAGDMTKAVDRIAPFKFLNPSQAWFYAFLNRWPDLKNYLYGPRSNRKSKGVSAESIQAYYDNLDKVLIKYDIKNKPDHIWMTDEVSIACDNSNVPKILPITIQRPQSNTYWNPTAAVLGAGNAAGDKIPAFLMFKASEISEEMMEGSVKGSKFATSNNGWVNADAFIQWYERHFRPLIPQRPVILLYDGHLQFVTVRVLEKAKEDNVLLFPLPPHPPYNHCVESSCFAAYPKYFTKRIQKYHEDFKRNVNKTNVSRIICQAYEWALQPINLIQTFFKLGICPYNNLSSSLAPYMPNSSDDDPNDDQMDNMDVNDADFVHENAMFGGHDHHLSNSITPLIVHSSPSIVVDRSFRIDQDITTTTSSSSSNHHNDQFNNSNNHSINTTNLSIYPSMNNNNSSNIKVLDNMASKAMNQMHAQRSDVNNSNRIRTTPSASSVPVCPMTITDNNSGITINSSTAGGGCQGKILSIKTPVNSKSSIIMRTTQTMINPTCKLTTSSSMSVYPIGSTCSSNMIKVVPNDSICQDQTIFISQSNNNNNNPIKVLKASNNVIIKQSSQHSSNNRPIIKLQSISSNENNRSNNQKRNHIIISKSDNHSRCHEQQTVTSQDNISTYTIKTVNTSITTPVVYESSREMEVVTQLMELKQELEDDQENGEINQTCHVCGRVEPPGLSQQMSDSEELVVDWAHCDFCYKWVHLQPCCDSRCVQSDNRFKCMVCIKQDHEGDIGGGGVAEEEMMMMEIEERVDSAVNMEMCIQEEDCYLLDDADIPPQQQSQHSDTI